MVDVCSLTGLHLWDNWSEPICVKGTNPPLWYQSRFCSQCNMAEFRRVQL